MLRAVWVFALLVVCCSGVGGVAAAEGVVEDNREASFLPPPVELLPAEAISAAKEGKDTATSSPKNEPAKAVAKEEKPKQGSEAKLQGKADIVPVPLDPVVAKPSVTETAKPKPVEKASSAPASVAVPSSLAPVVVQAPEASAAAPAPVSAPVAVPAPAAAKAVAPPAPVVVQAPASVAPVKAEPAAAPAPVVVAAPEPAVVQSPPVKAEAKVVDMPLPDIDPETVGLLSETNGGLGASLWKDVSRDFIDKLMPSIALPTSSATLNDLARRAFLTSSVLPSPSVAQEKQKRSFVAQRIEALLALGAVPEAWRLASMSKPELVDPVTLLALAEAALIGPESKEICDKVPSFMQAHAKGAEAATEWQKSLLICQLRAKDMKAVQLSVDMMRDQGGGDALFLSLVSKNVLGEAKQLPRQLTPLKPANLAVLRQLDIPLPSELYARPAASMILELLQAKPADEKARLGLAEKAGAKGILTPAQLAAIYQGVEVGKQDMGISGGATESSVRARAVAYQAALNEQGGQKKIELVQRFIGDVEPSVLTGSQIKLAASLLETIPVTSDYNVSSVAVARIFAMAGRPDKALGWLKLAKEAAANSPAIETQLVDSWPLFVLLGVIPDGDYAQGMKAWLGRALAEPAGGKEAKGVGEKRERAGKILLLLNAAGYAVPEEGWQRVIEVAPPSKQMAISPLVLEKLRQASAAGRKGETVLLSLVSAGGGFSDPSLGAMTEIVRALRMVGLAAESQALAREVMIGLAGG